MYRDRSSTYTWRESDPWRGRDWRKPAVPRWRLALAGFLGALCGLLLLFALLRWPLTSRYLQPVFLGPPTPAPRNVLAPMTPRVLPMAATDRPSPTMAPTSTPTSTPTPTPLPSFTPTASSTPSSTPTETPSSTPSPTESADATPTAARTPTPAGSPTGSGAARDLQPPDLAGLRLLMLEAINADRTANGAEPVAWDDVATAAGQAHAEDMAAQGYFSHWSLQGYGPEHRYALAGGRDAVSENVYLYWYGQQDGKAAPIDDWPRVIRDAEASLMDSPGHRLNILDRFHTHVGVGIAYDAQKGELRLAQEFINRWVEVDPLPPKLAVGASITVSGALLTGAAEPLLNLAYEPFPAPYTIQKVPAGTF